MNIKTGYFAYAKKYEEMGYTCVSIARITPKWFKGKTLFALAPTFDLLDRYKRGLITESAYKDEYFFMLKHIDMLRLLDSLTKENPSIVFLCYEKSEKFCHRHLLAEYLQSNFGIEVIELSLG